MKKGVPEPPVFVSEEITDDHPYKKGKKRTTQPPVTVFAKVNTPGQPGCGGFVRIKDLNLRSILSR